MLETKNYGLKFEKVVYATLFIHKRHYLNIWTKSFGFEILLLFLLIPPTSFAQLYYSPYEDMDTTTVAFNPGGIYILSAGFDGDIRLWRKDSCALQGIAFIHDPRIPMEETNTEFPPYYSFRKGILSLSWSPDGKKFAFGLRDRTVRLYSFHPGSDEHRLFEEIHVFDEHAGGIRAVLYSPDGRWIASGGHDKNILLWNAENGGRSVRNFCCHTGMVNAISFSSDGRYVVSGSDFKVRVWDVATGKLEKELQLDGEVYSVGYSRTGLLIGAPEASFGGRRKYPVILWKANTGKREKQLLGHLLPSWAVQFSPTSHQLASAGQDGKVIVWDTSTGTELKVLTHPQAKYSYRAISYSPDGKYIVAGNQSGPLPLWEVETGKLVREFGKCPEPKN